MEAKIWFNESDTTFSEKLLIQSRCSFFCRLDGSLSCLLWKGHTTSTCETDHFSIICATYDCNWWANKNLSFKTIKASTYLPSWVSFSVGSINKIPPNSPYVVDIGVSFSFNAVHFSVLSTCHFFDPVISSLLTVAFGSVKQVSDLVTANRAASYTLPSSDKLDKINSNWQTHLPNNKYRQIVPTTAHRLQYWAVLNQPHFW